MRALLVLLAGCQLGDLGEIAERRERGFTCAAQLQCERVPTGKPTTHQVCAAEPDAAASKVRTTCSALGLVTCAGARWWRCDVVCEQTRAVCLQ